MIHDARPLRRSMHHRIEQGPLRMPPGGAEGSSWVCGERHDMSVTPTDTLARELARGVRQHADAVAAGFFPASQSMCCLHCTYYWFRCSGTGSLV